MFRPRDLLAGALYALTLTPHPALSATIPNTNHSERRQEAAYEGYVFAYFTDSSLEGEKIYLAASNGNDALSWTTLNGDAPILSSTQGTGGLRDPFLLRAHDGSKFFLLATDLSIGSGTSWDDAVRHGSLYLEVWESADLITWSEQRHVLVSPETAGNTWAPEAHWVEEEGVYAVYWASSLYEGVGDERDDETSYHRMMYVTTADFVTFSEPAEVWQDAGLSRIDSTVVEGGDGLYYRFTKDEGGGSTGCVDIIQESASELLVGLEGWTEIDTCIGADAGTGAVEGPTAFQANEGDVNGGGKWYLFVDEYSGAGYIPLETDDIANPNWQLSAAYDLPASPRHGTVVAVTAAELEAVTAAWGAASSTKRDEATAAVQKRDSPVLPGLYADPNIAVVGDTYYLFVTTDGFEGWGGQEFYSWSSPDLVAWTRSETPFLTLNGTSGNVPWAVGNAWAPTFIERDGSFYFYFSGHNPTYDDKTIGVAVSTSSPAGPYVAEPLPLITNTPEDGGTNLTTSQAIDPAAFRDPVSGKYYLYWGNGTPLVAELSDDMVSLRWETAAALSGLVDFREGLFLNYRDGIYHLTYSIDDTRSEDYRVGYATSEAGPLGPFTYRGVLLSKDEGSGILGTGHNSVLNVPGTDEWFIAYHRFAIPGGNGTMRETTIDKLVFGDDGLMTTVVPTLESVEAFPVPVVV